MQTAGGRPRILVPQAHVAPSNVPASTRPFTIWTRRSAPTIDAAVPPRATSAPSPSPPLDLRRAGRCCKSALTRRIMWARTVFGSHTPWGGEDDVPQVAGPETALDAPLSDQDHATRRRRDPACAPASPVSPGTSRAGSVALVLDGIFEVRVDGESWPRRPGGVVGEHARSSGSAHGRHPRDHGCAPWQPAWGCGDFFSASLRRVIIERTPHNPGDVSLTGSAPEPETVGAGRRRGRVSAREHLGGTSVFS